MSDIECPHCEEMVEDHVEDYNDWQYANDLFDEGQKEVDCPSCGKSFIVGVIPTFRYESYVPDSLEEEDDEYDFGDDGMDS